MSYCLNPACQQPQNPGEALFCQRCGSRLKLGDRYRAIQVIGQGGFGRTLLAVDEAQPDKPRCVIKQLFLQNQSASSQQKATELFLQEVERLADLGQHPQIPNFLAHYEQDSGQYLVQEFIDGPNLAEALASSGPFPERQVRVLLYDLLPVLRFIHGCRVIHRDIKPENIIRPYTGDRLVLVDFGASKYASGTALARTGTVIGSAGYVAPEQAIGRAEFASDLYSLGVTCVHLLTGLHPFDLYSVTEDNWVWSQYLPEPVSDGLKRVLDKMLQRATSQRYHTATAVLQDLSLEPALLSQKSDPASRSAPPITLAALDVIDPVLEPAIDPSQPWCCLKTLVGHAGAVTTVAVSPDGQLLASGSSDKNIKLWSFPKGELLQTYAGRSLWFGSGHSDRISTLVFRPDQLMLISGSDDGTIKLWDLTTHKVHSVLEGGWMVTALAVSANGQLLVNSGGDGSINLWNLNTEEFIGCLVKHRDRICSLLLSPDGQTLISSGYDGTIQLWDLASGRIINTLRPKYRITAIAISPDWRTLISGDIQGKLHVWDLSRGRLIRSLSAHTDRVSSLVVSSDGLVLVSSSNDNSIKVWDWSRGDRTDLRSDHRIATVRHTWGVNTLSFSPNGQFLVSGSADETIKIWQRGVL